MIDHDELRDALIAEGLLRAGTDGDAVAEDGTFLLDHYNDQATDRILDALSDRPLPIPDR